jgi:hypothetical protein
MKGIFKKATNWFKSKPRRLQVGIGFGALVLVLILADQLFGF